MNLQICATASHLGACCKHLHIHTGTTNKLSCDTRGAIYKGENFLERDTFFHSTLVHVCIYAYLTFVHSVFVAAVSVQDSVDNFDINRLMILGFPDTQMTCLFLLLILQLAACLLMPRMHLHEIT